MDKEKDFSLFTSPKLVRRPWQGFNPHLRPVAHFLLSLYALSLNFYNFYTVQNKERDSGWDERFVLGASSAQMKPQERNIRLNHCLFPCTNYSPIKIDQSVYRTVRSYAEEHQPRITMGNKNISSLRFCRNKNIDFDLGKSIENIVSTQSTVVPECEEDGCVLLNVKHFTAVAQIRTWAFRN